MHKGKDRELYLKVSLEQAKLLTQAYSSSFSRSLRFVDASIRPAVYAIYGMVRVADEIVDTHFEGEEARAKLDQFEKDLFEAVSKHYSSNPILHAFQWAAHTYGISHDHITSFFKSMRLDTAPQKYTQQLYEEYIYGSAEVVGLMSLSVFCRDDKQLEAELTFGARKLSAAFQKVNFLRDIQSDFSKRHRMYFPSITTLPLTLQQKKLIEADIQKDFNDSEPYIKNLPKEARRAVTIAYEYYTKLFSVIKKEKPEQLSKRLSIGKMNKAVIFAKAMILRGN
jgi:phytoene synthase